VHRKPRSRQRHCWPRIAKRIGRAFGQDINIDCAKAGSDSNAGRLLRSATAGEARCVPNECQAHQRCCGPAAPPRSILPAHGVVWPRWREIVLCLTTRRVMRRRLQRLVRRPLAWVGRSPGTRQIRWLTAANHWPGDTPRRSRTLRWRWRRQAETPTPPRRVFGRSKRPTCRTPRWTRRWRGGAHHCLRFPKTLCRSPQERRCACPSTAPARTKWRIRWRCTRWDTALRGSVRFGEANSWPVPRQSAWRLAAQPHVRRWLRRASASSESTRSGPSSRSWHNLRAARRLRRRVSRFSLSSSVIVRPRPKTARGMSKDPVATADAIGCSRLLNRWPGVRRRRT